MPVCCALAPPCSASPQPHRGPRAWPLHPENLRPHPLPGTPTPQLGWDLREYPGQLKGLGIGKERGEKTVEERQNGGGVPASSGHQGALWFQTVPMSGLPPTLPSEVPPSFPSLAPGLGMWAGLAPALAHCPTGCRPSRPPPPGGRGSLFCLHRVVVSLARAGLGGDGGAPPPMPVFQLASAPDLGPCCSGPMGLPSVCLSHPSWAS